MSLAAGKRLGPYEIQSPLGAGGMGEVYRARDTRLERTVAIKVLPKELSADPGRKQRFEREAKTISHLNHPHICVLHDIGSQDGVDYLVMECVEGETLAKRLERGLLPLEQVLKYGAQIADALDKAHRAGIVHRDLKPGNIMLTATGAKLLDFGLAKLQQDAAPATPLSQLPTANEGVTAQGTILGTLQYMAPEQLEGKEADARTDIFAFGAVVYEMATGKKAFEGKSQASVISAIMSSDPPPMSSLQPMTPPALDRVVKKCLEKEVEKRWQCPADLCDELKWIAQGGSQVSLIPTASAKGVRALGWRALIFGFGALLLGAAISGLAIWNLKPLPAQHAVSRMAITLPAGQRLAGLDQPALVISPDGTNIVYVAVQGGTQQLFLRPVDSLEAKPIAETEGAVSPFFSPDGQWIGFFAGGKLKKVSVNGGAAVSLTAAPIPQGASWSSQGILAFQPTAGSFLGLQRISQEGGMPKPLTRAGKRDINHAWPEFLPGGNALFFGTSPTFGAWNNAQIEVQTGTGERKELGQAGTQPRYASTGHLLYAQSGTLMAAPFDARRLAQTGAAVPVLEGLMESTTTGAAQYSVSSTGTLVYLAGGVGGSQSRMVWVSRNGEEQLLPAVPHSYQFPRVSPDGRRVAVAIAEQDAQIWVYNTARDTFARLTFEGERNNVATWSPDGRRIAFGSNRARQGPNNLFWQLADGSGGAERLTTSDYLQSPNSFSPDGHLLAFMEVTPETGRDIWVLNLADHKAQPFLRTPYEETAPRFSPDGHWLAYSSDETGQREIYVQPYPGPGGKWQISTEGGQEPLWNPNGREVFYRSGSKIMAAEIDTKFGFSAGKPKMLFDGPYLPTAASFPYYDVSPDGQRFLMLKPSEPSQAPTQINVVLNWFEELKQKVPTGKK